MPALRNVQHERFARAYVERVLSPDPPKAIIREARLEAGLATRGHANGVLLKNPEVAARVEELMSEHFEYSDIRIKRACVKLDHIASANITDFYENGDFRDMAALPLHLADAVKRVEFYANGRVKNIELHDKLQALQLQMRHLGAEERPVTHNTLNVTITDEQRVAALMSLLARAKSDDPPEITGELS